MKKRKACISLEPAKKGCYFHMSREVLPRYLIDSIDRNSYDKSAIEALVYYEKLLADATNNYMNRTRQRLQVSEKKLLWEAVIVLESHHSLQDVKKLAQYFEDKYGWQPTNICLHADEGYEDEITGENVYNYHAHIVFFMLNKNGIYKFKKRDFGKKAMSKLQTEVSNILQMTRGKSKLKSGKERLTAKQYRQVAQEKFDLQFKLDRITEAADTFEDAMLDEQHKRLHAEDKTKELQHKLDSHKNIASDLDSVSESNEDLPVDTTTVIKSIL